ncbi:hypothetical protein BDN72DRAFT_60729 [Pluteus cervinus]|uniref:Uncharacterized protein n=1 Tax=Pluteus cervinus TaxID=181527 RepID=A0ACD2ZZC0_9AGAR|nr:hypothetical protein BDN72DRAFT_60729 [Pluteus cervinus]
MHHHWPTTMSTSTQDDPGGLLSLLSQLEHTSRLAVHSLSHGELHFNLPLNPCIIHHHQPTTLLKSA